MLPLVLYCLGSLLVYREFQEEKPIPETSIFLSHANFLMLVIQGVYKSLFIYPADVIFLQENMNHTYFLASISFA